MSVQQSILSQDLSLGEVFQSFYRVPDYQREYVWGEPDARGERGDEVEQFLSDIRAEYEQATSEAAPEYFIGTVVVCAGDGGVLDLIDGQQRTTTAFLTLCAIRDRLAALGASQPDTLKNQITATSVDWQGKATHRLRLSLQYEDAGDVLDRIGTAKFDQADLADTRSIRNIASAYNAVSEFLVSSFGEDVTKLQRFYGFFINKVKLIRIQTASVSKALKIFETINDRGVGLDAMDLLKNLLFMSAEPGEFPKLKELWRELTQAIYSAGEKPLRFLRYYLIATFDVDAKLREEEIYETLHRIEAQTGHRGQPIAFAKQLLDAARAYARFVAGRNARDEPEHGLINTRALGGSASKQHFILLLAGRSLPPALFTRLASAVEEMMMVWLVAKTPPRDYERAISQAARKLREVKTQAQFDKFARDFFMTEKKRYLDSFHDELLELRSFDMRKFRLKYLLAKITQHVDIEAYGREGRESLTPYLDAKNDVEHILARNANATARKEFGTRHDDEDYVEALGNLMWLERSINRSVGNAPYSLKAQHYPTSQFLLARCQATPLKSGVSDRIAKAVERLDPAPSWNKLAIDRRQEWLADRALEIWRLQE